MAGYDLDADNFKKLYWRVDALEGTVDGTLKRAVRDVTDHATKIDQAAGRRLKALEAEVARLTTALRAMAQGRRPLGF